MNPPPADDAIVARLGWRVEALEKSHEQILTQIKDGFAEVKTEMKERQFVSHELYDRERVALLAAIESANKIAMWALGLVATAVIVGLIGLLIRLASA